MRTLEPVATHIRRELEDMHTPDFREPSLDNLGNLEWGELVSIDLQSLLPKGEKYTITELALRMNESRWYLREDWERTLLTDPENTRISIYSPMVSSFGWLEAPVDDTHDLDDLFIGQIAGIVNEWGDKVYIQRCGEDEFYYVIDAD